MTTQTAAELKAALQALKQERKAGERSLTDYYRALLHMVSQLTASLAEEADSLSEEEVALQTPLLLLFLEEQIRKFGERS